MSVVNPYPISQLSRRRFLSTAAAAVVAATTAERIFAVAASPSASVEATTGTFLDSTRVHDISVSFDQDAYDSIIETFSESGKKEWIEAAVSINGTPYEKAGMRLKGNSSLMALRANELGLEEPQGPFSQAPGGDVSAIEQRGEAGILGPGDVSADEPVSLPWLIRLDKYVDGQNHNGMTELVIRSNGSQTSLNEAVALELLTAAGLASQRAAATRFSVNAGRPALRLAIENPNDAWMARHFSSEGLLYKAESTGDYSYRGDDPDSYAEVFDLEAGGTGEEAEDIAPLIEFLDFVNNSDDETFAAELPERLDTEQFAIYLAMMELINNFDDIDGPGNNSYLYYDPVHVQFTVVPWDMNLAFGGLGDVIPANGEARELPTGFDPSASPMPSRSGTPAADQGTPSAGQPHIVNPNENPNPLVQRFGAVPSLAELTDETRDRLRTDLYESGAAAGILSRWVELLKKGARDLVDQETLTTESERIAQYFTR